MISRAIRIHTYNPFTSKQGHITPSESPTSSESFSLLTNQPSISIGPLPCNSTLWSFPSLHASWLRNPRCPFKTFIAPHQTGQWRRRCPPKTSCRCRHDAEELKQIAKDQKGLGAKEREERGFIQSLAVQNYITLLPDHWCMAKHIRIAHLSRASVRKRKAQ